MKITDELEDMTEIGIVASMEESYLALIGTCVNMGWKFGHTVLDNRTVFYLWVRTPEGEEVVSPLYDNDKEVRLLTRLSWTKVNRDLVYKLLGIPLDQSAETP